MQTSNKNIVDLIVEMNQTLKNNPMLETIAKIIVTRRKNRDIDTNDKLTESETEQINNLLPIVSLPTDVSKSATITGVTPATRPPVPVSPPVSASVTLPASVHPTPAHPPPKPVYTSPKPASDNLVETIKYNIENNIVHNGIKNTGNICYLSSYVQLLSYIPEFVEELIKHKKDSITYENENKKKEKTYYNDVIDIFDKLYLETGKIEIKNPIFYKDGIVNTTQEDASEAMLNFFNRINLQLDYFKISEITNLKCSTANKYISTKQGKSSFLTLPINSTSNDIKDLLAAYQVEEDVNYKDEKNICGSGIDAKIMIKGKIDIIIPAENKYLLLALKRFSWETTGNPIKIDQKIELNKEITINHVKYILYGAIKHNGNTATSGHYIYYKINGDIVIEYDDNIVTKKKYSDVKDELEKNGYIVIYKRSSEMTGGNIYYQKYLKYKNKYLKLKNQVS